MKDTGRRKNKRKNYFIKRSFQARFFIGFVALIVIEALLIGFLFMQISGHTITTGYSGSRFVMDKTPSFFFVNFLLMSIIVGISIGLAGMLIFILLSHRVAGPLYRFEHSLRELSNGNLANRIQLRRMDQLNDLQEAFNQALKETDTRLQEIKGDLDRAHDLASQKDSDRQIDGIKDAIARAKDNANFFKTS
jgi:methyl-accepting chemotaxis protein